MFDVRLTASRMALSSLFSLSLSIAPVWAEEAEEKDEAQSSPEIKVAALDTPIYDHIVVMASADDVRSVVGSAQYISELELEKYDYSDVNRILRAAPGVNIQEEDGFGLRPNVGLRGTGLDRSSKIAILEDGILAAPAPYAAPSAYYFPVAGRMQSVEVVKGAAGVKYGPLTTGGAINLLSTQIPDAESVSISARYGSHSFSQFHGSAGTRLPLGGGAELGLLAETIHLSTDGFKELDSGGDTGFDIEDWVGKVSLSTGPNARFEQSIEYKLQYSDEISDETYLGLTQADFQKNPYRRYRGSQLDEMDTEHNINQLTHRIAWTDSISMTTVGYRTEFQRNWFKLDKVVDAVQGKASISSILSDPVTYADAYATIVGAPGLVSADDALDIKNNNRSYSAQGVQVVLGVDADFGATSHVLELSARYHEDEMDRFQWVDSFRMDNGVLVNTTLGTPGTDSNRIDSAEAWAFFVQDEITVGNWTIVPGVRYEMIDLQRLDYGKADPSRTGASLVTKKNSVDVVIPGFGAIYELENGIQLLASVHKGFTHPSPGSTAEAEESVNYEAGARYADEAVTGEAILFYNDYSNLVGTCTASTGGGCVIGDQFDGGEVKVKGAEISGTVDVGQKAGWRFAVPVTLAYTWTQTEFQNSFVSGFGPWGAVIAGDEMPYIPEHQVNLSVGIDAEKWRADVTANYVSETRSDAGQGPIPLTELIDSRVVVDLGLEYRVTDRFSVTLGAENLFDEVYSVARRPAGLRPGKPQSFFAGVKVNY